MGLETGDPGLLAWLEKPGSPQDAVDLVGALHEAGIAAGVIVLLGAGGERFAAAHAARTAEVLTAMRLGPGDLVYFSEYVDEPGLAYGRRAAGAPDLQPLSPARNGESRRAILAAFRPADPARPPRGRDLRHPRVRVLSPRPGPAGDIVAGPGRIWRLLVDSSRPCLSPRPVPRPRSRLSSGPAMTPPKAQLAPALRARA